MFAGQTGNFRPAGIFCIAIEPKSISNLAQPWLKAKVAVAGKNHFKLYPLIFIKNFCPCMSICILPIAEAARLVGLLKSCVLCTTFTVSLSEVLSSCVSDRWQGISQYLVSQNIMTALSGVQAFLKSVSESEIWSPLSRNKIIKTWNQNTFFSIF